MVSAVEILKDDVSRKKGQSRNFMVRVLEVCTFCARLRHFCQFNMNNWTFIAIYNLLLPQSNVFSFLVQVWLSQLLETFSKSFSQMSSQCKFLLFIYNVLVGSRSCNEFFEMIWSIHAAHLCQWKRIYQCKLVVVMQKIYSDHQSNKHNKVLQEQHQEIFSVPFEKH